MLASKRLHSYEVTFFQVTLDEKTGKKKNERLGSVNVDDYGTGPHLTLTAKAFRQAPPRCQLATKVTVDRTS